MKPYLFIGLLAVAQAAQPAEFVNLDFEALVQPLPPPDPFCQAIPVSLALPGWHVPIICYDQADLVHFNTLPLSLAGVTLLSFGFAPEDVIQGDYSVFLGSGLISPLPTGSSASILQTGLVPQGVRSLVIKANLGSEPIQVFLGGESIGLVPQSAGPNYVLYAGDITAHAGLEQELRISIPYIGTAPLGQAHSAIIDDIRFSTVPVPEPGTWMLLALGMAGLIARLGRRSNAQVTRQPNVPQVHSPSQESVG